METRGGQSNRGFFVTTAIVKGSQLVYSLSRPTIAILRRAFQVRDGT